MEIDIVVGAVTIDPINYDNSNCQVCVHLRECRVEEYYPDVHVKNVSKTGKERFASCCESWWPRMIKEGINETR